MFVCKLKNYEIDYFNDREDQFKEVVKLDLERLKGKGIKVFVGIFGSYLHFEPLVVEVEGGTWETCLRTEEAGLVEVRGKAFGSEGDL